ncbi:MAG: hypothetical protein JWP85_32 [Rhodoglobus sp.]|nr:hypothetical protein [Rhodoglobus sp.]
MTADPDEEATSWAGDTDPSHVAAPEPKAPAQAVVAHDARPAVPAALLIAYGVLGGAYLLYTAGWFASVVRLNTVRVSSGEALSEIMFQLGEFLAIASPVFWFGAVFLLTRGRKLIVRLLWLLAGILVLLPWPFVLGAWL